MNKIKPEEMFLLQSFDEKKRLPFTTSYTSDIIKQMYKKKEENLAIFFASTYIRSIDNLPLIDIGYSPTELIELTYLQKKCIYFSITSNDYIYSVEFFSNATIFDAEEYFAKEFITVPQNLTIEYQGKRIKDDNYLFDFNNSKDDPFQISFKDGYQLFYIYFDQFSYVCMKEDSTLKDLKYSISSKNNIYFGVIYGERTLKYFNTTSQTEIDQDMTPLNELSNEINIFDFDFKPDEKIKLVPIDVIIENDQNPTSEKFHIDDIDQNSTVYFITCILEREFQIDRSLFIPYDQKDDLLGLTSKIPTDLIIKVKINSPLIVRVGTETVNLSYMTTIDDIRRNFNFKKNQFGIIINKHFAFDRDGKPYLTRFLRNVDDSKEPTEIILKYPITTCHIRSFTNTRTKRTKRFIVPDFFSTEKTVCFYLHKNPSSFAITKKVQDEKTFKIDYEYHYADTRDINITFIDENNKNHDMIVEVRGENPRIIDLLLAVDDEKRGKVFKKYYVYEAFLNVNQKFKKLDFMQPLSQLSYSKENEITVQGYIYQKKKDESNKMFIIHNNFNGNVIEFKYENLSAKEIIEKVVKQDNLQGEKFDLYMEYKKLKPEDHPLICKCDHDVLTFNISRDEKIITIANGSILKVPMKISKEHFTEVSDMITGMFNLADLSDLAFRFLSFNREHKLPLKFDGGCLPDNCEVSINYIHHKSDFITFEKGKKTKIELSNIDLKICQLKTEIQEKLQIYDMSLNSMCFVFFNPVLKAYLDDQKSFIDYKIPEDAIIKILPKEGSFRVGLRTPEKVVKEYIISPTDTIKDIKNLIKHDINYDKKIVIEDQRGHKMSGDQKVTPGMKLSLNSDKVEIESGGSLTNKKHKVNDILTIKEANEYLKNKLQDRMISIFIFNEKLKIYEAADPTKKLYEIENKLFVHKLFNMQNIYLNDIKIQLLIKDNLTISECNKVEWFRKNIFSNKILASPSEIIFYTKQGKVNETKMIYEIFNNDENPVKFKFISDEPTISKSIKSTKSPQLNQTKSSKLRSKCLPEAVPAENDTFSKRYVNPNSKSTKSKEITKDDDEAYESDSINSKEAEKEELITYNIQIGREEVSTLSLKKGATVNDAKIKIAKEQDDIDPNCVTILFEGKNLKKSIVIEKLKLTEDDILQVYIRNFEEILNRTSKALQIYGDRDIEDNYSDDDDNDIDDDENQDKNLKGKEYQISNCTIIDHESKIDLSNYTQIERIGCGASGEVFKIKDNKTGELYAAKILFRPISVTNKTEKLNLYRELNIMSKIQHPNIVKLIGFSPENFHKEDKPVIITELSLTGTLNNILENERKGLSHKLWDDTRKLMNIYSIASAMSFLHSHGIIHRDLKPLNILMNDELYPKVADFGLSKMIEQQDDSLNIQSSAGIKGTSIYMAPESITKHEYTKASDVYAFAMIVYEIITGKVPFKGFVFYKILKKVPKGVRPTLDESIPNSFKVLISRCWEQKPENRPTFDEIVEELNKNYSEFIFGNADEDEYLKYIEDVEEYQIKYDSKKKILFLK